MSFPYKVRSGNRKGERCRILTGMIGIHLCAFSAKQQVVFEDGTTEIIDRRSLRNVGSKDLVDETASVDGRLMRE